MRILLTGATGFVGRHLYARLSGRHELHLLVRPSTDYSALCPGRVFCFRGDVERLADYLRRHQVEGIIHLASLYLSSHRPEQVADLVNANILLGASLLEAAKIAQVKWFLNTGTIWQNYRSPEKSDEYHPVNLYAATKQAFITLARYYQETSPIRFSTLKLCDTYGPGDTRRKILALFGEIARSGEALAMSPGEQRMDLLHIDDVVAGFEVLANRLADPGASLLPEYVLTSGHSLALRELARLYERVNNVSLSIEWGGRPYREREVMDPYKGNVLPGWSPKVDLETGMRRMAQEVSLS